MAPEIHLFLEYDSKIDIWSLGISLLQLAVPEDLTVPFFIFLIIEQRTYSKHLSP
jgi:serine/threonine protein kinase